MKYSVVTLIVGVILACLLYPFLSLITNDEFSFYDCLAVVMSVMFPSSHRYWGRWAHDKCLKNIERMGG